MRVRIFVSISIYINPHVSKKHIYICICMCTYTYTHTHDPHSHRTFTKETHQHLCIAQLLFEAPGQAQSDQPRRKRPGLPASRRQLRVHQPCGQRSPRLGQKTTMTVTIRRHNISKRQSRLDSSGNNDSNASGASGGKLYRKTTIYRGDSKGRLTTHKE